MQTHVDIYTDGSCLKNPGGAGGWAWFIDSDTWESGYSPSTTNNRMELQAILAAVKAANQAKLERINIITDSYVCIYNMMKIGPDRKYSKKDTNIDLKKAIDAAVLSFKGKVDWGWCKGHSGLYGNEWADSLALDAANNGFDAFNGPGMQGFLDRQELEYNESQYLDKMTLWS